MRLNSLDYLRGLAAIGIVIYHFNSWSFGAHDSGSILSRFGLYGVSIFYMLSGLTLFHIYENKMFKNENVNSFFIKRFFRIMPLLWLVTTITILGAKIHFEIARIFLNYSGLFSIFAPTSYIAGGAWSIGNEISFYLLFPLVIFAYQKKKVVFFVLMALFLLCHIYFAFFVLSDKISVPDQWVSYINPLNQVFFFMAGTLIYILNKLIKLNRWPAILLFVSGILLFVYFPVYGNKSNLIIGSNKIMFTLFCSLIIWSALNINATSISPVHHVLKWLGEISYSVYLLHPLMWKLTTIFVSRLSINTNFIERLIIGMCLTLISSHLIYNYFELVISKFGRKFTVKPITINTP
jgi:exopolysaccharide production protein ExoZ